MTWTVDAHHHVWDLDVTPQTWLGPEMHRIDRDFSVADFEAVAGDRNDRSIVVQTVPDSAETPLLLAHAAEREFIIGVVGWVDLTSPAVSDRLDDLLALPTGRWLVGIRHTVQDESDPRWLLRPDVQAGLAAVGNHGLVYDLLVKPPQLDAAIETVSAHADVRFVLDHLGKPPISQGELQPWSADLRRLADHPNVACKLSGLATEADLDHWTVDDLRPYVDVALDAFGPDRLMFGSDWPVCLLAGSYDDVFAAATSLTQHLDDEARRAVWGTTAIDWYGLDFRS